MRQRLLDSLLLSATVDTVEGLAPRWRRIVLAADAFGGVAWQPGQHVRVQVGDHGNPLDWVIGNLRTYTVSEIDGASLSLAVFDHGDGPGAQWARTVQPGDPVKLTKPEGRFVLRPSPYYVFAGEETASVGFGALSKAVAAESKLFGIVEVDTEAERLPLITNSLTWTYRHGRPAASSSTLVDELRQLTLPDAPGLAYFAGEARTVQMLRAHFVIERGWPRQNVLTKPYWTPGRTGLD